MKRSNGLELTVVFAESQDGGFVAYINEFPGCMSQGETLEEVKKNILDAAQVYFEAMLDSAKAERSKRPSGRVLKHKTYRVKPPELVPVP